MPVRQSNVTKSVELTHLVIHEMLHLLVQIIFFRFYWQNIFININHLNANDKIQVSYPNGSLMSLDVLAIDWCFVLQQLERHLVNTV